MLKNITLFFICYIFSVAANAQPPVIKVKPHPVEDSIANVICECIMSRKDTITSLYLFYAAVNDCLKRSTAPKIDALLKEDGFVQKDDRKERADAIRMLGLKIGQKVAAECNGFKTMVDELTEKENKKTLH